MSSVTWFHWLQRLGSYSVSLILLSSLSMLAANCGKCHLTDGRCPSGCTAVTGDLHIKGSGCRKPGHVVTCEEGENESNTGRSCFVNEMDGSIVWFTQHFQEFSTWRRCTGDEQSFLIVLPICTAK